jgi:hypothetical protein
MHNKYGTCNNIFNLLLIKTGSLINQHITIEKSDFQVFLNFILSQRFCTISTDFVALYIILYKYHIFH